jgi:hypothetical protein
LAAASATHTTAAAAATTTTTTTIWPSSSYTSSHTATAAACKAIACCDQSKARMDEQGSANLCFLVRLDLAIQYPYVKSVHNPFDLDKPTIGRRTWTAAATSTTTCTSLVVLSEPLLIFLHLV